MIDRILTEHAWLWPVLWQSTAILALGLGGSFVLRKRAVRAHQLLLLAMIAALVVPLLSLLVKRCHWGLLEEEPPAVVQISRSHHMVTSRTYAPAREAMSRETVAQETAQTPVPHVESPAPAAPTAIDINWRTFILPTWGILSLVMAVRLLISFVLGYRLVRQSQPCDAEPIVDAVERTRTQLGIKANVRLRSSPRTRNPMIWCWGLRPTLLVPEHSEGDETIDWPSVICHELAHWKRRDHLSGLWAELVLCVLPWNPLAFLAKRRLVRLSEEACDDWTIASGQLGTRYARTLLGLTAQKQPAMVPGIVTSPKTLALRVRRILADRCGNPHPGRRWTLAAAALATCLAVTLALAQTRPAGPIPAPELGSLPTNSPTEAVSEDPIEPNEIRLRLVDAQGKPVSGAKAGDTVSVRDKSVLGSRLEFFQAETADENGEIVLDLATYIRPHKEKGAVYILHEHRRLGAMLKLDRNDAGKTIDVALAPLSRVHGVLDSPALRSIGMPLTSGQVYVEWNDEFVASQSFVEWNDEFAASPSFVDGKFQLDISLPPGRYTLRLYGYGSRGEVPPRLNASTMTELRPLEVPGSKRDLDLGTIELPPTKLATLIGKPAPELGPIKAWKNGSPVTLADLRGQVVYLYFDAECRTSSRDLPPLVELHEAFGDKGLTIIALYNCSSLEELDQNWEKVFQLFGGVREVPFRIAIDGESTFHHDTRTNAKMDRTPTYGAYGITGVPTSVLIDPAGRVLGNPNLFCAKETIQAMLGGSADESERESKPWQTAFEAVYRLEEDEVLRRIAPPFIPERMEYYRSEHEHQAKAIPGGPDVMSFHWNGKLKPWGMTFGRTTTIGAVLDHVLRLKRYEYGGPKELLTLDFPGDWIVRDEMPKTVKLKALEDLIEAELGRKIRFEKQPVERQVIVATGRFKLHPPVETYNDSCVHMYADELDPHEGSGGGTADSVAGFLQALGNRVNMPVIDQTDPGSDTIVPYRHHSSSRVSRETNEAKRLRKLHLILEHLTTQTELRFEVETRPVEVWIIGEERP